MKELRSNTPEQIEGYLTDALALVERLEIPGDLREAAFAAAVNLFSAKQIIMTPADQMLLGGIGVAPGH